MHTPIKHVISNDCTEFWAASIRQIASKEICGLTTKKYQFSGIHGSGYIDCQIFDGLYIEVTDIIFSKNIKISGIRKKEVLELSFLIDGEKIIKIHNHETTLIYESQECYLTYINQTSGTISYHKNKRLKEVKICMNQDFIQKHRLLEAYDLAKEYALTTPSENVFKPICAKTQELLAALLSDTREGLLKRLFLESKALELLALQLDNPKGTKQEIKPGDPKISKKLFGIQKIITADLTTQYSIQKLARDVGLNDFVAKKEFKRIFGETIFEFALKQRMTKAKQLLVHTQKPIYEISELVGYKNATHFSAAFKKATTVTPKKYRNASLDQV